MNQNYGWVSMERCEVWLVSLGGRIRQLLLLEGFAEALTDQTIGEKEECNS